MRITNLALALALVASTAHAEAPDGGAEARSKAMGERWAAAPYKESPEKPPEVPAGYIWWSGRLIEAEHLLPDLKDAARHIREKVGPLIAVIQPWRGMLSVESWVDDAPADGPVDDGARLLAIEVGVTRWGDAEDSATARQGPLAANPFHLRIRCGSGVYPLSALAPKGHTPPHPAIDLDPGDEVIGWIAVELPGRVDARSCDVRFEDSDGKSEWINLGEAADAIAKYADEVKAEEAAKKKAKGKRKNKRHKRRKKRR